MNADRRITGDFATDVPFRINVNVGKIVRAILEDTKNSHSFPNLISNLSVDSGLIILNKSFIGRGDYGDIDL